MLIGDKNLIESDQKLLLAYCPINNSLKKKPANIEPIANTISGTSITYGDSCIEFIFNSFNIVIFIISFLILSKKLIHPLFLILTFGALGYYLHLHG